jgi:hypothetical protein
LKKLWLLLLMVIPLQLIHSQELKTRPTVEQCRADHKLWLSKLEEAPDSARYFELNDWASAMLDCITVDPSFQFQYLNLAAEAHAEINRRFELFLVRHHLYDQFVAEDKQDKR